MNLDGKVIGVNAAIASQGGMNSGVGFSIPVRAVRLIVPALIEKVQYDYPYVKALFDGEISLEEVHYLNGEAGPNKVILHKPGAGLILADDEAEGDEHGKVVLDYPDTRKNPDDWSFA